MDSVWTKPGKAWVEGGQIVVDLAGGVSYPLVDAAKQGRALRALVDVRTDDDACGFTANWGLLYQRLEDGRADRFPLERFYLERRFLIELIDLSEALKSGDASRIATKLRTCGGVRRELNNALASDPFETDLTEAESQLVAAGYGAMDVFMARYVGPLLDSSAYAGRLLADELHQARRLQFERRGRDSRLVEVVDLRTLNQALRWSIRSHYRILHHIICESCGNHAVVRRADARYCGETCGGRTRVQRSRLRRSGDTPRSNE